MNIYINDLPNYTSNCRGQTFHLKKFKIMKIRWMFESRREFRILMKHEMYAHYGCTAVTLHTTAALQSPCTLRLHCSHPAHYGCTDLTAALPSPCHTEQLKAALLTARRSHAYHDSSIPSSGHVVTCPRIIILFSITGGASFNFSH